MLVVTLVEVITDNFYHSLIFIVTKISGLLSDNTIDMKTTVKSMGQCLSSGVTAR